MSNTHTGHGQFLGSQPSCIAMAASSFFSFLFIFTYKSAKNKKRGVEII